MRRLILGTAGHIDHGKTALVKALTGVDTDRLKEEQERGITVDLGFAEYQPEDGVTFGVVDVPGHEGFIRNMLAGATGMDLVLLVVAADEGVMPQTREHLAIVELLGVPKLSVAVTKVDLVEPDWLELVRDDVFELLSSTPFSSAPIVDVSAKTGVGLEALGKVLGALGQEAEDHRIDDVVRLPIDRVFTIRGTGTVVTGTLWSGTLTQGDQITLLPGDVEGRVRGIQVHGNDVRTAPAGTRVAVGIKGSDVSHHDLARGQTLVAGAGWSPSWMLSAHVKLLPDTGWVLEQGQRVRIHLGTAEVLARAAVLQGDTLLGGEEGWIQFRLEDPVLARVRDHLVIRSYSPVTTIGGGQVVEVFPRKRRRLKPGEGTVLPERLSGKPQAALVGLLDMVGVAGVAQEDLAQRTGLSPAELGPAQSSLEQENLIRRVEGKLVGGRAWARARETVELRLSGFHEAHPLRPGIPLQELRQVIPGRFGPKLVEAILKDGVSSGIVVVRDGFARLSSFAPSLDQRQQELRKDFGDRLREAGLAPPSAQELSEGLSDPEEGIGLLRYMAERGEIVSLDGEFFVDSKTLHRAGEAVVAELGARVDLGPADFRECLPVTRRHLLPLLRFFDLMGVTTRVGDRRSVSPTLPGDWGTLERPKT